MMRFASLRPLLLALCLQLLVSAGAFAQGDPLPSWNPGSAKQAILNFVKETTEPSSPKFVPPADRVATFDQDGTLWTEQPIYPQVMFAIQRVNALIEKRPELREIEPYRTALTGDIKKINDLLPKELEKLIVATSSGMSVEEFKAEAEQWIATAKHPRFNRPYTELVYQPMVEVLAFLRANGYKTYIVTGGGQDFVRTYAEKVYGIPPEQIIGSAGGTKFTYTKDGRSFLIRDPRVLLNDNYAGKAEGIHLVIGRRPRAAFGNSIGDRQMLEYTRSGEGTRLTMLVMHDDGVREYAYGPAQGLPDSRVGTFPASLFTEARSRGFIVISMKKDWKKIFPFEP